MQELAEGRSLADLVASGWRADEAEVARITRELLEVRAGAPCAPQHMPGCCHGCQCRMKRHRR